MFLFSNLIMAVAVVLDMILSIYMWIIIIRAIMSWVTPFSRHPVVYALIRITEPVLSRIRGIIPLRGMPIDLSPIIAIAAITFLKYFVVNSLYDFARSL